MPSFTPTGAGLATLAQAHGSTQWYKDGAYRRSIGRVKSGTEAAHRHSVCQGRSHLVVSTDHGLIYCIAPSWFQRLALSLVVHD